MQRYRSLVHELLRISRNSKSAIVPIPDRVSQPNTNIPFTPEEVQYHIHLCHQIGLLEDGSKDVDGLYTTIGLLTWIGHDWIESYRSTVFRNWMKRKQEQKKPRVGYV